MYIQGGGPQNEETLRPELWVPFLLCHLLEVRRETRDFTTSCLSFSVEIIVILVLWGGNEMDFI